MNKLKEKIEISSVMRRGLVLSIVTTSLSTGGVFASPNVDVSDPAKSLVAAAVSQQAKSISGIVKDVNNQPVIGAKIGRAHV